MTPTLEALEWATNPQEIDLTPAALIKLQSLQSEPPPPSPRLRRAAKRHGK
jgi:hypothetical protein